MKKVNPHTPVTYHKPTKASDRSEAPKASKSRRTKREYEDVGSGTLTYKKLVDFDNNMETAQEYLKVHAELLLTVGLAQKISEEADESRDRGDIPEQLPYTLPYTPMQIMIANDIMDCVRFRKRSFTLEFARKLAITAVTQNQETTPAIPGFDADSIARAWKVVEQNKQQVDERLRKKAEKQTEED